VPSPNSTSSIRWSSMTSLASQKIRPGPACCSNWSAQDISAANPDHRKPTIRDMGHDLAGSRNDDRCRRQACTPCHHLRDECGKLTQEGRTKCKAKAPPRKLIEALRQSNKPLSATKHSANIKPSQPRIIILIVALHFRPYAGDALGAICHQNPGAGILSSSGFADRSTQMASILKLDF
jgi:hypothetical protein